MNREKLKYLPFNFLWCIISFMVPFLLVSNFTSNWIAVGVSLYIYLMDVKSSTEYDYLESRINKLENK